ncbi:MAG: acetyltransferase [Coprobacillus cateniformis]|nr:acetyltransferase [Coprobacillus cateniformis]
MRNLLIVGAGGHGRCCLDIARDMNLYEEIAFLDDAHVNEVINKCKVIGTLGEMSSYYPEYTDIFIAVGNNKMRKKLSLLAKEIGYHLTSLISPNCYISRFTDIGDGIVVFPHAVIEANASIGEGCIITSHVTINHDAVIEDYCLIYSNTVIRPNTFIGSLSRIGSNCTVTFGTKMKSNSDMKDGSVIEPSDEYSFEVGV